VARVALVRAALVHGRRRGSRTHLGTEIFGDETFVDVCELTHDVWNAVCKLAPSRCSERRVLVTLAVGKSIVGQKLAQRLKVRFEVQVHTDFLSPCFKKGNFKNWFRVSLGKKVLSEADCIRVVSNRIKKSIEEELPHIKVTPTVLPIFIDIKKIQQTPISTDLHKKYPQFDHITLMVSRLEKEKDIKRVIKAFSKIIENHPKAGLVIVGEGSERKSLESSVKRLNLGKNVVFEGWHEDCTLLKSPL